MPMSSAWIDVVGSHALPRKRDKASHGVVSTWDTIGWCTRHTTKVEGPRCPRCPSWAHAGRRPLLVPPRRVVLSPAELTALERCRRCRWIVDRALFGVRILSCVLRPQHIAGLAVGPCCGHSIAGLAVGPPLRSDAPWGKVFIHHARATATAAREGNPPCCAALPPRSDIPLVPGGPSPLTFRPRPVVVCSGGLQSDPS